MTLHFEVLTDRDGEVSGLDDDRRERYAQKIGINPADLALEEIASLERRPGFDIDSPPRLHEIPDVVSIAIGGSIRR